MQLEGKIAVVIAGAHGVGRAVCHLLLECGTKVVVGDINAKDGVAIIQDFQKEFGKEHILFKSCDVQDLLSIEALFDFAKKSFGAINIVYSGAGYFHEFEYEKSVDVNLLGQIRVTNAALKHLSLETGGNGGAIVAMASISGLRPEVCAPVYSAGKAAVIHFIRGWAEEVNFKKTGVRFNCVCPTTIDTAFVDASLQPHRVYNYELIATHKTKQNKISPEMVAKGVLRLFQEDLNGKAWQAVVSCKCIK